MKKSGMAVVIFTLIFLLSACEGGLISTPIGKILSSPRDYEGKVVKINGTVTQSMNLMFLKYFALNDKTGEIYVVTKRILPKQGDSVSVKGHVEEGFTIGSAQFIVMIEDTEGT